MWPPHSRPLPQLLLTPLGLRDQMKTSMQSSDCLTWASLDPRQLQRSRGTVMMSLSHSMTFWRPLRADTSCLLYRDVISIWSPSYTYFGLSCTIIRDSRSCYLCSFALYIYSRLIHGIISRPKNYSRTVVGRVCTDQIIIIILIISFDPFFLTYEYRHLACVCTGSR